MRPIPALLLPFIAAATITAVAQRVPHQSCRNTSNKSCNPAELSASEDAKPMMRWWWFGVAVDKEEIHRELAQMKADGIGGVEIAFVYPQIVDDPPNGLKNDSFLSSSMLENLRYAQQQARDLGLRVDVTLGSGWPYGGPATTIDEAAHRLRLVEARLAPGQNQLPVAAMEADETLISTFLVEGEPQHWASSTAQTLDRTGTSITPTSKTRTVLFFIDSHTKQKVKRAAAGAEGWVLDPFQKKAVMTHLSRVGEPLLKAFGNHPPSAIFSDSLEAYGADWTPSLPKEFKKRRGYDLLPHLPELFAGDTADAARIRHDWGKTLTELVEENYLVVINEWAKAHHTRFRSQTYGEPAVTLSSQRLVTLPEGEGPYWRQFNTLRWATSANHLYGRNITSAETFTWLHSPVFRATPLDMKAEADLHFLVGTNQIIGHGWPYSPPQVGEPGWSLYAAAVFNDHNPWHPVMPAVTAYIQQVSSLLRQGKPANQVAVLLPIDDAWASFVPGHVTVTGSLAKMLPEGLLPAILDAGYNFDFIDPEAITRVGIPYPLVVVPPTKRISITTLQALERYVHDGGKVIAVSETPTITPDGKHSAELINLSGTLFNDAKKSYATSTLELGSLLRSNIKPDLTLAGQTPEIGFIRRKSVASDIYFLANTNNISVSTTASFNSVFRNQVVLDPTTGETLQSGEKRDLLLSLAPYESRIVIFSNAPTAHKPPPPRSVPFLNLSNEWHVRFPGLGLEHKWPKLVDWTTAPETEHYSGEAIYQHTFELSELPRGQVVISISGGHSIPSFSTKGHPGMQAWYEGPVREGATMFVNGTQAGFLWHPPYRINITQLLKQGSNSIELHVYNTALNAWSSQSPHDYSRLIETYGDRFQMQDLDKVRPISSGILGSVQLETTDDGAPQKRSLADE